MNLDRDFWENRYAKSETGWDLGAPSTPLKEYLDQLLDKGLRILIPGGGRAYEAEHAHRLGFKNVFVIDLTDAPLRDLLERCPDFPREHFIVGDFFLHDGRRYSHEIDPATAAPVQHGLASVSVVAPDCTHADAWSTALFVLGPERGLAWLERHPGEQAVFLVVDRDRTLVRATPGLAASLRPVAAESAPPI